MTEAPGANCLTAGTMIDTPDGPVRIDDLTPGDLVVVMDGPPQPVRMIHAETISGDALKADRALWPVCIQAGALGFGLPRQNLRVSPAHRMLYRHIRIPLMFGEEILGLVLLTQAPGPPVLNYEDRDLLKTAGNHVAVQIEYQMRGCPPGIASGAHVLGLHDFDTQ